MKRIFFLSLIGFILTCAFTPIQPTDAIDRNLLVASCKKKLEPYKYDSQQLTRIFFTKKTQHLEVEVAVFSGGKYRIVLNLTGIPENLLVGVNIYTKPSNSGKREVIFTNKDLPAGTKELIFDVPRVRKLFIDYDIPAADAVLNGYILCMVGYK